MRRWILNYGLLKVDVLRCKREHGFTLEDLNSLIGMKVARNLISGAYGREFNISMQAYIATCEALDLNPADYFEELDADE